MCLSSYWYIIRFQPNKQVDQSLGFHYMFFKHISCFYILTQMFLKTVSEVPKVQSMLYLFKNLFCSFVSITICDIQFIVCICCDVLFIIFSSHGYPSLAIFCFIYGLSIEITFFYFFHFTFEIIISFSVCFGHQCDRKFLKSCFSCISKVTVCGIFQKLLHCFPYLLGSLMMRFWIIIWIHEFLHFFL